MRGAFLVRLLRLAAMAAVLTAGGAATPAEPGPRILKAKGLQTATFMQFSPDGRFLAAYHIPMTMPAGNAAKQGMMGGMSGSGMGAVAVWDVAKGKPLWRQQEPMLMRAGFGNRNSHLVSFSPDSSLLAVPSSPMGERFNAIDLYSAATGRLQRQCKFDKMGMFQSPVAFSPNGKLLVFALMPDLLQLWNPKTARQLAVMRQPYPSTVMDVAFSPDSQVLVTCGGGMNVQAMGVGMGGGGMNVQPMGMGGGGGFGGGGFTATATGECVLDFWDTAAHKVLHTQKTKESVAEVAFSPDGKLLAALGMENLLVYDAATAALRHTIEGGGRKLAFSADGKSVVVVSFSANEVSASIADLARGRSKTTVNKVFGEGAMATMPALSADGRLLAVAASNASPAVVIYDTHSGRQRAAFHRAGKGRRPTYFPMGMTCVFSPDGRTLATARADGVIELWPIPEDAAATSSSPGK